MSETCGAATCWCCGNGHFCEPSRYPSGLDETWTCPECGTEHVSFSVDTGDLISERIRRHIPPGTFGWRTVRSPEDAS